MVTIQINCNDDTAKGVPSSTKSKCLFLLLSLNLFFWGIVFYILALLIDSLTLWENFAYYKTPLNIFSGMMIFGGSYGVSVYDSRSKLFLIVYLCLMFILFLSHLVTFFLKFAPDNQTESTVIISNFAFLLPNSVAIANEGILVILTGITLFDLRNRKNENIQNFDNIELQKRKKSHEDLRSVNIESAEINNANDRDKTPQSLNNQNSKKPKHHKKHCPLHNTQVNKSDSIENL